MKNLSSYCGLVDAKIRASDKDLPVSKLISNLYALNGPGIKLETPKPIFP